MESIESIASAALLLPDDQRLALAQRILASVESQADPRVEEAWDREIRARIDRFDSGRATPIPGPEVFREIDRKLAK